MFSNTCTPQTFTLCVLCACASLPRVPHTHSPHTRSPESPHAFRRSLVHSPCIRHHFPPPTFFSAVHRTHTSTACTHQPRRTHLVEFSFVSLDFRNARHPHATTTCTPSSLTSRTRPHSRSPDQQRFITPSFVQDRSSVKSHVPPTSSTTPTSRHLPRHRRLFK